MAYSSSSQSLYDTTILSALKGAKVGIVFTEWNDKIVNELKLGAERIIQQFHASLVASIAVPGSFELPFGCRLLMEEKKKDRPEAIIALGAVIRGGTPHFEYVSKAVTDGIAALNLTAKIPVIFGVLTLDTEEQAWERLGGTHGHKGEEAALAALKMIALKRSHRS